MLRKLANLNLTARTRPLLFWLHVATSCKSLLMATATASQKILMGHCRPPPHPQLQYLDLGIGSTRCGLLNVCCQRQGVVRKLEPDELTRECTRCKPSSTMRVTLQEREGKPLWPSCAGPCTLLESRRAVPCQDRMSLVCFIADPQRPRRIP